MSGWQQRSNFDLRWGWVLPGMWVFFLWVLCGVRAVAQPILGVPAYFYPGSSWQSMVTGPEPPQVVIMNPASGPGMAREARYAEALERAHEAGIIVIGYVPTTYGNRDSSAVLLDAKRYVEWYGVDGILLDEATSDANGLPYYTHLYNALRKKMGLSVVLNPGTTPVEDYMAICEAIVTFEGGYDAYAKYRLPEWAKRHSPKRFIHLVYDVSSNDRMQRVLAWAVQRNVGVVYVTNDAGHNPYDSLPTYWNTLAGLLH